MEPIATIEPSVDAKLSIASRLKAPEATGRRGSVLQEVFKPVTDYVGRHGYDDMVDPKYPRKRSPGKELKIDHLRIYSYPQAQDGNEPVISLVRMDPKTRIREHIFYRKNGKILVWRGERPYPRPDEKNANYNEGGTREEIDVETLSEEQMNTIERLFTEALGVVKRQTEGPNP